MLPSFVHDIRNKRTVDILEADNATLVQPGVACTFNPTSHDEMMTDAGIVVQSDGSFFFKNKAGQLPVISESNTLKDADTGQLYTIVSVIQSAGEDDRLQVLVRYV